MLPSLHLSLFVAIAIEAANKLTSKSSGSVSGSLKPQPTLDSPDEKPVSLAVDL